ncbi:unnamed protein product [Phytophthora lilii]|uniref:4-hydroxybenzoate polyprenyltransferase, mitochondrial n=1 Tax=Phytophthora lilii TaxID=2077276 RepID=A0A9W6WV37_9STRA|nr:unnamed protein product [Phytophthora lilii]
MAARFLLSRSRPLSSGIRLSISSATRGGSANFTRLSSAVVRPSARRVPFASTQFAGTQTSWFSSSTTPQTTGNTQTNGPDVQKHLELKTDVFSIEKDTWAERHCPEWMLPYIQISRLNRPGPTFLLLWPCFWSISMAAPAGHLPDLSLLALFSSGALIMRGAGCTINDMWDKDFDKKVERTNKRPLAAGKLTYPQAWGFLAAQLSAGLAVLLQLNWYCVAMGASSLALVAAYPTMKRVTYWPQAFLGLTFNYGALLGWAAVHGSCEWPVVLPLYAGGVAWTLVYDTLYAHQDKKDDVKIGVRSTALLFGDNTKPVLNLFSAAAIAGFGTAGYMAGLDWPFFLGLSGGAAQLAWQLNTAKLDDPINLQARFASNKWFGALMFASVVAGNVV